MLDVSSLALHMPASLTDTFRLLDLCGVLLNGILGGLIARRKNFDLVGFVVLAMLTATAGGILRDVMIQAGPPFALTDPYYLYTACLGATVAWFVPLTSRPTRRLLVVADAVILGCWAATGASKALTHGLGVMPALLLGCLTAIGGSMIRDVAVGETPAVFGGNKLYAIPALIAAGTQVLAVKAGVADAHAMLVSTAVGAGLCVLAYWRSWQLPVIADLCLDEFTDHGHCGVLADDGRVDNDATLTRYEQMAVVLAAAGATMTGQLLKAWVDPAPAAREFSARAFGMSQPASWTQQTYLGTATLLAYLEPDPAVEWTLARAEQLLTRIRETLSAL